jgi:hypothetical protein
MKRLPTVSLKTPDGMTVTTDWRKHAVTVIVMLHDGNCHACRATCQRYVAERAVCANGMLNCCWSGGEAKCLTIARACWTKAGSPDGHGWKAMLRAFCW